LNSLEKDLVVEGVIGTQEAIKSFEAYSFYTNMPNDNSKRSYRTVVSPSSPDTVFSKSMKFKSYASKSKSNQSMEVDLCINDAPLAASPSHLRRSTRIFVKSLTTPTSFSSKEFAYIDPLFDENARL
jgi:hypothetical protein